VPAAPPIFQIHSGLSDSGVSLFPILRSHRLIPSRLSFSPPPLAKALSPCTHRFFGLSTRAPPLPMFGQLED